ncbi:citrate transporter [Skermanella stibiiresistens SB22]|uniref:Citrate transporter n=1 Tax=Skermanella stibiiresistens SB22 TaxID=1385369 RepID=W9H1P1_9PROT|nr:SLC13 family permease [Skermanella stibiiresistens]EWY38731.1 citrate transporter [Skermanella stibiiresistens SB22]
MSSISFQTIVVFALLIGVFVAFVREWVPPDIVALSTAAILLLTGVLDTSEVLAVFSNSAVATVAAMFVLSAALERTGVVEAMGTAAMRMVGRDKMLAFVMLVGLAVVTSAFINNTPVVVILTPVAVRLCLHLGMAPSKLLIPLSFAAIFGGTCTLIGTSTNLLVDGVAQRMGMPAFSIFEITGFGIIMALIGITYLVLIGYRLLPDRETTSELLSSQPQRQYLTEVVVPPGSPVIGLSLREAKLVNLTNARVIDVVRQDESLRRELDKVVLGAGDRILMKSGMEGVMGLRDHVGFSFDPEVDLQEMSTRRTRVVEGIIGPRSSFVDHKLAEFNLRRRYGLYMIAVHRQGVNLRGKFEEVSLEVGDMVILEGPEDGIRRLVDSGDLINLTEAIHSPMRHAKAPIAIGAVLAVVILAALDVMPIAGLALIAAVGVVLTGCLDRDEAYRSIEWRILFLILGMLTLGTAMEKTGAVELVAGAAVDAIGRHEPLIMLSLVYLLASALTEIVSNNAVAVLLTPIGIGIAHQLGVDPRPFVVAVMFGASASFATPIGYQTNTFVYGAGGYKYMDFVKVGLPLNVIFWIAATFLIPLFWPF